MAVLVRWGNTMYLHSRYVWNGSERMIITWEYEGDVNELYRRHREDLNEIHDFLYRFIEGAQHDSWMEKNN